MPPKSADRPWPHSFARTARALSLLALLGLGDGCVAFGLSTGMAPGYVAVGSYPEPGSRRYKAAVALGYVADWLFVPLLVGIPMLIFDYVYLHSWDGGYAARWVRGRGEGPSPDPPRRRVRP